MKTRQIKLSELDKIVVKEHGFWFFYDEIWVTMYGPFNTQQEGLKGFFEYSKHVEDPGKYPNRTVKFADIKLIPSKEEFDYEKAYNLLDAELPIFIEELGEEYSDDEFLNKDLVFAWNNKREEIKKMLCHD